MRRMCTTTMGMAGLMLLACLPAWSGSGRPSGDAHRAVLNYYRGEYRQAEQEYRNLLDQSGDPELARDLAVVLATDNRFAEAAEVLRRAGLRGEELGEIKLALGDWTGAQRELKQALQEPGDHMRTHLLLGLLAELQHNRPSAVEHYWKALEDDPRQGTVHLLLARSFTAMSDLPGEEQEYFRRRAREEYRAAVKSDSSLWQVQWDLGRLAERDERWKDAIRYYRQVRAVAGAIPEVEETLARLAAALPPPTPEPTPRAVLSAASPPTPTFQTLEVVPVSRPDDPILRVGLGRDLRGLAFGCTGPWRARDHRGRQFWKGVEKTGYRIERLPRGGWALKRWDGTVLKPFFKTLVLEPVNPKHVLAVFNLNQNDGYWWSRDWRKTRYYRGDLQVVTSSGGLDLINRVALEEYLLSVVPGEMPASWPMDALKAQAVVARTDSLLRRGTHRKHGYDVCPSAHCAVYRGVEVEHPRTWEALAATRGEVLKHGDRLIPTFYHHACGGITQYYQEAWWDAPPSDDSLTGVYDWMGDTPPARALPLRPGELPSFLAFRPAVFCRSAQFSGWHSFRWLKIIRRSELNAVIERRYDTGPVQSLKVTERSLSGYVREVEVTGEKGRARIRKDRLRSSLGGLRSNLFFLLPIPGPPGEPPTAWLIWGGGWGHGVGLCQAGTGEMAQSGYTYTDILSHYFPDGELALWP